MVVLTVRLAMLVSNGTDTKLLKDVSRSLSIINRDFPFPLHEMLVFHRAFSCYVMPIIAFSSSSFEHPGPENLRAERPERVDRVDRVPSAPLASTSR